MTPGDWVWVSDPPADDQDIPHGVYRLVGVTPGGYLVEWCRGWEASSDATEQHFALVTAGGRYWWVDEVRPVTPEEAAQVQLAAGQAGGL